MLFRSEFNAVETKSDDTMYIIVDDDGTIVESGGMQPSVYDPQGRATDIFAYVDNTHNTNTEAHSDIRDLITGLTNRLNALADSDDTTLDQLSEIVAYIKNNKTLIDGITTSKVNVMDIIDNLTTNVTNKPLSAAQGVALKALIDAIPAWAKSDTKPTYTASEVGAATEEYVNQAIQTAISDALGGSY